MLGSIVVLLLMDIDEFGMEFIKYDYGSLCKLQLHARAVVFTRKVSSSIEKEIVGIRRK